MRLLRALVLLGFTELVSAQASASSTAVPAAPTNEAVANPGGYGYVVRTVHVHDMGKAEANRIEGCYTDLQNNTRTIATPYGANNMSIEICANLCSTSTQV